MVQYGPSEGDLFVLVLNDPKWSGFSLYWGFNGCRSPPTLSASTLLSRNSHSSESLIFDLLCLTRLRHQRFWKDFEVRRNIDIHKTWWAFPLKTERDVNNHGRCIHLGAREKHRDRTGVKRKQPQSSNMGSSISKSLVVSRFYPQGIVWYRVLLAGWHRNQINKIKSCGK